MFRVLKSIIRDTMTWALLACMVMVTLSGMTTLSIRFGRVEDFQNSLSQLESDVNYLHHELESKRNWCERLKTDPTAWEQVARERMNYLGVDEVLVTFESPR